MLKGTAASSFDAPPTQVSRGPKIWNKEKKKKHWAIKMTSVSDELMCDRHCGQHQRELPELPAAHGGDFTALKPVVFNLPIAADPLMQFLML